MHEFRFFVYSQQLEGPAHRCLCWKTNISSQVRSQLLLVAVCLEQSCRILSYNICFFQRRPWYLVFIAIDMPAIGVKRNSSCLAERWSSIESTCGRRGKSSTCLLCIAGHEFVARALRRYSLQRRRRNLSVNNVATASMWSNGPAGHKYFHICAPVRLCFLRLRISLVESIFLHVCTTMFVSEFKNQVGRT